MPGTIETLEAELASPSAKKCESRRAFNFAAWRVMWLNHRLLAAVWFEFELSSIWLVCVLSPTLNDHNQKHSLKEHHCDLDQHPSKKRWPIENVSRTRNTIHDQVCLVCNKVSTVS